MNALLLAPLMIIIGLIALGALTLLIYVWATTENKYDTRPKLLPGPVYDPPTRRDHRRNGKERPTLGRRVITLIVPILGLSPSLTLTACPNLTPRVNQMIYLVTTTYAGEYAILAAFTDEQEAKLYQEMKKSLGIETLIEPYPDGQPPQESIHLIYRTKASQHLEVLEPLLPQQGITPHDSPRGIYYLNPTVFVSWSQISQEDATHHANQERQRLLEHYYGQTHTG